MQFGVRTGIPTPEKPTQAKESKTVRYNRETVWNHLRKFVANGWLRAFPPSSAWILSQWRLRVSSTHFVDKTKYTKERLVTDLGNLGGEGEGQDANTLSPDLEYANVQADYIDDVERGRRKGTDTGADCSCGNEVRGAGGDRKG